MLPLSAARTYEEGFPIETGIPGFQDNVVLVSCGTGADIVYSSTPLVWVRGASISLRELHEHLPLHRQAREAKSWAEAEDKAYR